MRARAASFLILASVFAGTIVASCNDDGRTLRDPRPDQVGTVSTTAAPTTTLIDPNVALATNPLDPLSVDPLSVDTGASNQIPLLGIVQAPWVNGGAIPDQYTCNGLDVSPALSWSPAPTGTVEIALTLVDQDNPSFVHWVMSGIDALSVSLAEGIVAEFATVGVNGNGEPGYAGPCPPAGTPHTYVLTVHYLDQQTELGAETPGADLQAFVNAATFESLSVAGTYSQG